MVALCQQCSEASDIRIGYCRCGGVRLIAEPITDENAEMVLWPPSPLVRSCIPGLENVYLKYEGGHVTGSFKDRIMRHSVADAVRSGAAGAVVPSSGNAALAAAAAGARSRLPILAIVPTATPQERIAPVLARGATVIRAGNDPSEAYRAADLVAVEIGLVQLYSTFKAPVAEWACRRIGIEASRQLGAAPAAIVAPVSAGPVLAGAGNGTFQETGRLPPLVAVQAEGCCPIARAFQMGHDRVAVWTEPVNTVAVSIADRLAGYPEDGTYTLSLVRQTGGRVAAVSDEEMRSARAALLQYDGLDVELSGAAGIAWLRREPLEGNVICILTASGFKHTYKGDLPLLDEDESRRAAAEAIAGLISSAGIDATIVQQTDVRF